MEAITIIWLWIMTFFGLGIGLGIAIYLLWQHFIIPYRYPFSVTIREKREGEGYFGFHDRAKIVERKRDGTIKLRLMKLKKETKPIKFSCIGMGETGRGGHIDLYSPAKNIFVPMQPQFESESAKLKVIDEDTRQWFALAIRERDVLFSNKPSLWERIYPLIIPISSIMLVFVCFILLKFTVDWISSAQMQMAEMNLNMGKMLSEAIQNFGTGTELTTQPNPIPPSPIVQTPNIPSLK